ncbi:unnamed protein product [Durusdinium trenchii]|uniref:Uncharacterized protein n=1 Tax=Durusdinium trenchii TaxID=1381693 RepID=A0ABP0K7V2_9DINO
MATAEKEKKADLDFVSARDSYIPLFDGTLSGYREWRKRILIYYKKMCLSKRQGEAILNLLGSLSGTAWKLCEDFDIEQAENDKALDHILTRLDSTFRYDSKVELPADFSAYFEHLQRRQDQTLLQFVTDHDDKLKQVEKHGVKLPDTVQGWHLLAKSGLTREQKQMLMTQSAFLERAKAQQAMYAILGQDYKGGGQSVNSRWQRLFNSTGKGRGYFAGEDNAVDLTWDNPSVEWEPEDEGTYYLDDEQEYLLALTDTFDSDQLSMEPSFDLQLEETLGDPGTFDDFLTEEHIYQDYTPSIPDEDFHMTPVEPASAPDLPGPRAEHEDPEPPATEPSGPPADLAPPPSALPAVPEISDMESEPSAEPVPPTPNASSEAAPSLDPVIQVAFQKPEKPETFQQQRMRLDRQETMSFGPQRTARASMTPYMKPPQPENAETVFEMEDLDADSLPPGWIFQKDTKTLELKSSLKDFWEIKSGCLIRHHVNLRSKLFDIRDRRDLPIPVEDLDDVQVTVYREPGSNPHSVTNHFKTENIFKSTKNSKNAENSDITLRYKPFESIHSWQDLSKVKAVLAGNHFIQALDVDTCPVEQEYFWSPLAVLCTLLMLFSAILSFATYKFGRFLERRHWRNLVNTRIRVTTGRHERHKQALKDQLRDLHLQHVEKVCELEERLAELIARNQFLRTENDAVLVENHADQDELAELNDRHRRSCALFTRAFREIQGHLEDCPLEHGVVTTPFGAAWHAEETCRGTSRSGRVVRRHACNFCGPGVQTPFVTNSVSGTTLYEDFQEFVRQEGRCSYEEWIVD